LKIANSLDKNRKLLENNFENNENEGIHINILNTKTKIKRKRIKKLNIHTDWNNELNIIQFIQSIKKKKRIENILNE
jgi:hypothetical protein